MMATVVDTASQIPSLLLIMTSCQRLRYMVNVQSRSVQFN